MRRSSTVEHRNVSDASYLSDDAGRFVAEVESIEL